MSKVRIRMEVSMQSVNINLNHYGYLDCGWKDLTEDQKNKIYKIICEENFVIVTQVEQL